MSVDELLRAFCYFLIFPAFTFFGFVHFNRRQRLVAVGHFLLSAFFLLLMIGLVTRHYYQPITVLLYANTIVVLLLTIVVTWRATVIVVASATAHMAVSLERELEA